MKAVLEILNRYEKTSGIDWDWSRDVYLNVHMDGYEHMDLQECIGELLKTGLLSYNFDNGNNYVSHDMRGEFTCLRTSYHLKKRGKLK